jgi:hypothetical protein
VWQTRALAVEHEHFVSQLELVARELVIPINFDSQLVVAKNFVRGMGGCRRVGGTARGRKSLLMAGHAGLVVKVLLFQALVVLPLPPPPAVVPVL